MSVSPRRIAVLMGGWCSEREISLVSGEAAMKALIRLGHNVEAIDVTRTLGGALVASFAGEGPEIVFNALHGPFGEDGRVQALLEFAEIPYTHSGVLASGLAMDKPKAKAVLSAAGLPVPEGQTIDIASLDGRHPAVLPYVLKPVGDGSSFGVYIITKDDQPAPRHGDLDAALFGGVALLERYVPGRELTVAVLGDEALGVTEIVPKKGEFYDFQSKYAEGGSKHVLPADIPADIAVACRDMGVAAAKALGCRGLSRTDFRWDEGQGLKGLFILEVNTQPGLTPTSLAPEQAAAAGMGFDDLIAWMVEDASCPR